MSCYYTVEMAMFTLGIGANAIRRMCRSGRLAGAHIGPMSHSTGWYIPEASVNEMAALIAYDREHYCTMREAAATLGITKAVVERLCRIKTLRTKRDYADFLVLVRRSDIDAYLEGRDPSGCTRCGLLEPLDDGLCIHCQEELRGTYRWYPLDSGVRTNGTLREEAR
jgi:hypothetical protein